MHDNGSITRLPTWYLAAMVTFPTPSKNFVKNLRLLLWSATQRKDWKRWSILVPPEKRAALWFVEAGCRVTWLRLASSIFSIPQIAMADSSSVCNRCRRWDTAPSPPTPSAKKIGFPIPTAEAPRAVCSKELKNRMMRNSVLVTSPSLVA